MDKNKRITRISLLWLIVLIGLVYHTVLHLVPVFYGIGIEKLNATGEMPVSMVFTFGFSYLIPVVAIVTVNFLRNVAGWMVNMLLSFAALLVNTGHLSEFFIASHFAPTQLFVIIPVFLITLFLVRDSWKLKKDRY